MKQQPRSFGCIISSPPAGVEPIKYLAPSEAARIYGVGRSTLYVWMRKGWIEWISLRQRGRSWGSRRIVAESLDAFFAAHTADSKSAVATLGKEVR